MSDSCYRNPVPTVDIIIYDKEQGIVLVERKNPPYGWALPGGFVDYGESVEAAAIREAKEETSLDVTLYKLLNVYSDPKRDPRFHTLSITFIASAKNPEVVQGGDDAQTAKFFSLKHLPALAFDHATIIQDFMATLSE